MKKIILTALVALTTALASTAQFYNMNLDKVTSLIKECTLMPDDNAALVMTAIMQSASTDGKTYRKTLQIAERTGNPVDSLHSEAMYLSMLKYATTSGALSTTEKQRYIQLLDETQRNAMGTAAADIDYVTPDGKAHQLSELTGSKVLLFFNDPDCESCATVKQRLATSPTIAKQLAEGKLVVLGIYTGSDEKLWRNTPCPDMIVNGWNKSGSIDNEERYILPTTPLFYLLDSDHTVLVKNEPSLKKIEQKLVAQ